MNTGMYLHRLSAPQPPEHNFLRRIPATVSPRAGCITLYFYTPPGYSSARKYPVLVNFHGGGFTIGHATDDSRWAGAAIKHADSVVVSVDYRLAPEYAFPTAIEDGVDALLYLASHAEELHIDPHNIGVSGFSAGGNMAFTVLIRLYEELRRRGPRAPDIKVVAIAAWYPSTDFTHTRAHRRATSLRPDKELPRMFTDLFDASYLWPPRSVPLDSPYLSPGVARDRLLKELPTDIFIYTCEWDELLAEAERFRARLVALGKKVTYRKVEGAAHAWDKTVGPGDTRREEIYKEVCTGLKRVFYGLD